MSASLALTLRRPVGASQKIAYTGTAGSSTKLDANANSVMVFTTTLAFIKVSVGNAVVAALTTDIPITPNTMVILPIEKPTGPSLDGQIFVSAIQDAAGGNLYVQALAD